MKSQEESASPVEAEVKFLVAGHGFVRDRLSAAGAIIHSPRTYERNVRFDTPDQALLRRLELLRLRQDQRVRLTFKGEAPGAANTEIKVREELEVTVDNFDLMAAILERLGFAPAQVYEKYRETYHLYDVEVVLDELPFGDFVELEGPEASIKPAAEALGLDWSKRILTNYLALMMMVKQARDLPFDDLTFDNFRGRDISMAEFLPVCTPAESEE